MVCACAPAALTIVMSGAALRMTPAISRRRVRAVVWFAVQHPYIAASIALTLLVLGALLLWIVWRLVRRGWRRFRTWRHRRVGGPGGPGAPQPLT